jgi:hypothetical protein
MVRPIADDHQVFSRRIFELIQYLGTLQVLAIFGAPRVRMPLYPIEDLGDSILCHI